MSNGEMIDQLQKMLEEDATIPQGVTNGLLLSAVRQVYRELKEVKSVVESLERSIETDKVKDERNVTWPWAKDNVIMPIVRTAITLGVGYLFFRIFGTLP